MGAASITPSLPHGPIPAKPGPPRVVTRQQMGRWALEPAADPGERGVGVARRGLLAPGEPLATSVGPAPVPHSLAQTMLCLTRPGTGLAQGCFLWEHPWAGSREEPRHEGKTTAGAPSPPRHRHGAEEHPWGLAPALVALSPTAVSRDRAGQDPLPYLVPGFTSLTSWLEQQKEGNQDAVAARPSRIQWQDAPWHRAQAHAQHHGGTVALVAP